VDPEVSGKANLIVRGSSGMGAAAAQVLAATGAHVGIRIFGRGRAAGEQRARHRNRAMINCGGSTQL